MTKQLNQAKPTDRQASSFHPIGRDEIFTVSAGTLRDVIVNVLDEEFTDARSTNFYLSEIEVSSAAGHVLQQLLRLQSAGN